MLPQGLSIPKICRDREWNIARAITGGVPVLPVARAVRVTATENGFSATWVLFIGDVHWRFISLTPYIIVNPVRPASTQTCPIWQCQVRIIHSGLSKRRCGLWLKTVFPIARPLGTCGEITGSLRPGQPFKIGSRRRGKKEREQVEHEYLPWALSSFSGYIAADEVYDGPFCILSIVDNRTFRRLAYEVLDHDPTHQDIEQFFTRFKAALESRGLALKGITTDASPLYPEPIRKVFGPVLHQICQFHILAELTKAILKAVSKVRKTILASRPKLPRGRPRTKQAKRMARLKKRLQRKVADLFDNRHLFVQHHLTVAEKKTLARTTRGMKGLRTLREIMDEVYRLFDRRCSTQTALNKLHTLRKRVRRFKKLSQTLRKLLSPNLEKALTYLDDSLLPATSNAVERANRRYRKMQKSIYCVRTQRAIICRIALDLQRSRYDFERNHVIMALHKARAG